MTPTHERISQPTRRTVLSRSAGVAALLAGAGLLPLQAQAAWNARAFEVKTLAELARVLGGSVPAESKDLAVTAPDLADNGAVVQVGIATTLPGVKQLLLLVEKNPNVLSASFDITDAIDPAFTVGVKMGQTSQVLAVALMKDNRVLYAQKEVKVTLGGCGA
ncbi:thiosulfate oxidation carrier protein SoxY [Rubrivivax rivuli]|uniref:Thiosulfate oxidation carrier protein SoxY n=1 Tax=Rubrivivax rivuli TaxID=1862385 RepID=A0A437RKK4_9BURK|nr:thiosulfate oxidation carrier protein SoxY [Rubrivivax rivuli]RVU47307.1 thiosulfate oxidation carrier protein SoxY [Rubrivivax rivuli]